MHNLFEGYATSKSGSKVEDHNGNLEALPQMVSWGKALVQAGEAPLTITFLRSRPALNYNTRNSSNRRKHARLKSCKASSPGKMTQKLGEDQIHLVHTFSKKLEGTRPTGPMLGCTYMMPTRETTCVCISCGTHGPGRIQALLCHSDLFISQLIDRADRKLFKQIQLSHHCLNSVLPSSLAFLIPGHQFSLPLLNTVLYKNMFVKRCLF